MGSLLLTWFSSNRSVDKQIRTDRTRAESYYNRIRLFLPKVINSTPANLLPKIPTLSIQSFSSNIQNFILDEYTKICSVANCTVTFVNAPEKATFNHLSLALSMLNWHIRGQRPISGRTYFRHICSLGVNFKQMWFFVSSRFLIHTLDPSPVWWIHICKINNRGVVTTTGREMAKTTLTSG